MTHNGLKRNGEEFMRVFLFAGLLDIALGVAFLAAPLPPAGIQEVGTGDANVELQATRNERVSPLTSFVLLACGITLIVIAKPGRRKPEQLSDTSSPITSQAPENTRS
jgi:hypothetical protein